jgi:signal peptidase II
MKGRHLITLAWAAGVSLLAMALRALVQAQMVLGQEIPIIPGLFSLRYVRNPGAAFGLFAAAPTQFRIPFFTGVGILALIVVTFMYVREGHKSGALRFGLAMLGGGAVANLLERLLAGEVVDYLDLYVGWYHWPTFNLADIAINVGVGLLALDAWRGRRSRR